MSFEELARIFLLQLRLGGRRPRTLGSYAAAWRHFQGFCQVLDLQHPNDLEREHLVRYRLWMQGLPIQPGTAGQRFGMVRAMLRWAYRQRVLFVDPGWELSQRGCARPVRRLLSPTEVQRWLAQPDPQRLDGRRDGALLELFYGTGLRLGECARLDLDDLNRRTRTLRIRGGKTGDRYQPLGDHLAGVLDRYLETVRPGLARPQEKALWVARQGTRLSADQIGRRMGRYARRAGLVGVSTHSLRHAFATHLLEARAPLWAVQALLGHRTLLATQTYTHLLPLELLREYRRTHPRARRRRS